MNEQEREKVSNLLKSSYTAVHDWNHPDTIEHAQEQLTQMKAAFNEFEKQYFDQQMPLIMQPIWRTVGQSPEINKDNAFDLFIWSNYAYTRLFLERDFIRSKKLTRTARCMIRVAGYLYEAGRVRENKADINEIFARYTVDKQSDKDMSVPAGTLRHFMTQNASPEEDCVLFPRIPRSAIKEIIKGGGHKKLQPERRLDQSIYFTYKSIK